MPISSKTVKQIIIELERAEGKLMVYNELLSVCKDIKEDKLEVFSDVFPKYKDVLIEEVTKELNETRQKITEQIDSLSNIEVKVGKASTSTPKPRAKRTRAKKPSKST